MSPPRAKGRGGVLNALRRWILRCCLVVMRGGRASCSFSLEIVAVCFVVIGACSGGLSSPCCLPFDDGCSEEKN